MNTIHINANICSTITERNASKGTFYTFNIVELLPFGKVQYYSCVCYDREKIKSINDIKNGSGVLVLGELKLNKYKKNDIEHTAVNIVIRNVVPLDELCRVKTAVPYEEIETYDDLPF